MTEELEDELRVRRAEKIARCAKAGHDWVEDETGAHCSRCPIQITATVERA